MTTRFAEQPRIVGYIPDPQTGRRYMWLESDGNVYCFDAERDETRKIASATKDGALFDLNGQCTGDYLKDLHGTEGNDDGAAFARLKQRVGRLSRSS